MSHKTELLEKVVKYHQHMGKEKVPFTAWKCSGCKKMNPHRCPTSELVSSKGYWDSTMECISCNMLSFVAIYPNGKCHTRSLEDPDVMTETTVEPRSYKQLLKFLGKDCAYGVAKK